jgi:hypothetical protein
MQFGPLESRLTGCPQLHKCKAYSTSFDAIIWGVPTRNVSTVPLPDTRKSEAACQAEDVVVHVRPWPGRASAPLIYSFVCLPRNSRPWRSGGWMNARCIHCNRHLPACALMKTLKELVRTRPRKQKPGPVLQYAATSFCGVYSFDAKYRSDVACLVRSPSTCIVVPVPASRRFDPCKGGVATV